MRSRSVSSKITSIRRIGKIRRRSRAWCRPIPEQQEALAAGRILVKDSIADITLQQVLTRPDEF